jgi:hypothetical protein
MKTIRSGLSNVLVLVLLAGLSALLIALLSNANSGSATSRPPALAVGNGSPLATLTIASVRISPLATPGVASTSVPLARIGAPVLVHSSGPAALLSGDQQKLVSIGRQGDKAFTTLHDLTTGKESKIADDALPNAHLSGHWLVYQDLSPVTSTLFYNRIIVINIDTGKKYHWET